MNKQEILNEINKTKEHLSNIKMLIEELQNAKEQLEVVEEQLLYTEYKPQINDTYFFITADGQVKSFVWDDYKIDQCLLAAFNVFETQVKAEAEAEKILVRRQLENIARRLNKGEKFDWNKFYQPKYYIYLGNYGILLENSTATSKSQGTVYCLDENFRDVAIKEIGEERLKKYLRGE